MSRRGATLILGALAVSAIAGNAAGAAGAMPMPVARPHPDGRALGAAWAAIVTASFDLTIRTPRVMTVDIIDCEPLEPDEPAATGPSRREIRPSTP